MDSDRRSMLAKGMAALCAAAGVLLTGRFLWPHRVRDLSQRVTLGPAAALPRGSSRYLPEQDMHLVHAAGGVYAVSGRCTHLGCSVLRRPDGFACPCHGARFDLLGHPISGPAPRPLRWHRVSIDRKRNLVLHLDEVVQPGTMTRV